jgi:NDP-sugar pyrophosphorylase family protein
VDSERALGPSPSAAPKVLLPVVNRPILDRTLEGLSRGGVDEATLCLNYMADAIRARYGDGGALGMKVRHSLEADPLGTGASVGNAREFLDGEPFLVQNGDILTAVDYGALRDVHASRGRMGTGRGWRTPSSSRG